MRKWIILAESLDRLPPEAIIEYFAEENCASFAYALWLAHGKPVDGSFEIVSDPNDETWDGYDECFTHVVYATGDNALIDVRGVQSQDEILDHYYGYFGGSYHPEEFWRWAVGMGDDKPLYGDRATVNEALAVIREYPSLYGLTGPLQISESAGNVPTVSFPVLYHIGTLDPEHKRPDSYEGNGVSVSLHPAAWRSIARLGGNQLWEFTKQGNRFLAYHAMSDANRQAMSEWGVQNGLVASSTIYRVCWEDEDDGEKRCFTFDDEQEAKEEYEDRAEWDDTCEIETVEGHLIGTQELARRCHQKTVDLDPLQLLATLWADEVLHLDGVWWEDRYDPHNLSAPRGVIFLSRLGEWQKKVTSHWPDEEDDY